MEPSRHSPPDAAQAQQREARRIVLDCLRRREAGEILPDEDILSAHPELVTDLREELNALCLIKRAQEATPGRQSETLDDQPPSKGAPANNPPMRDALSQTSTISTFEDRGRVADDPNCWVPSIPDYEFVRVCGRGAFGKVWIVRDRAGVPRAMKVINLHQLTTRGIAEREIRAVESYCRRVPPHPNLVQIFHIGRDEKTFHYTMELADDLLSKKPARQITPDSYEPMTLLNILKRGRLTSEPSISIILRLLSGVNRLHTVELVHRDIKPANILIVNRQVKLADVSLLAQEASQMSLAGTPYYMPPDGRMDSTADTYAVGKIMYELLTGSDLSRFPQLPDELAIDPTVWDIEKLNRFLARACASSASHRFSNAGHMREELLQCKSTLYSPHLVELAESEEQGSTDVSRASQTAYRAANHWLRLVPWFVILVLGIYLIHRLT